MAAEALLRGLVVVRGDHQQAVGAGLLGGAGELDAVVGVVGAGSGDDVGAVADRFDHGAYELGFLRIAGGRGLTGGAVDDQAVVACVDQVRGEALGAVEVEGALGGEGSDHGGQDPPEGCLRCGGRSHGGHATRCSP